MKLKSKSTHKFISSVWNTHILLLQTSYGYRVGRKLNNKQILRNQHSSEIINSDWLLLLSGACRFLIFKLRGCLYENSPLSSPPNRGPRFAEIFFSLVYNYENSSALQTGPSVVMWYCYDFFLSLQKLRK